VELERAGVTLARRLGDRSIEIILLGNSAEDARRTGNWEWAIGELESALQLDIDAASRRWLVVVRAGYRAYMGEMTETELDAIRKEVAGSEDTDIMAGTHEVAAAMAAGAGHARRAHDEYLAMADASSLNAPYLLPLAAIQAVLAGDAALARADLERLRDIGTRGRAVDANRLGIEAGIAALDGDPAGALAGFRQSIAALRELGLPWDEAWITIVAMSVLGAGEPETLGWATRSADFLESVGARPAAELLAKLVAATPAVGAGRSRGAAASASGQERASEAPASG
jgi:hypothetical protein